MTQLFANNVIYIYFLHCSYDNRILLSSKSKEKYWLHSVWKSHPKCRIWIFCQFGQNVPFLGIFNELLSTCKRSSLRSQSGMRLLWFSNTVWWYLLFCWGRHMMWRFVWSKDKQLEKTCFNSSIDRTALCDEFRRSNVDVSTSSVLKITDRHILSKMNATMPCYCTSEALLSHGFFLLCLA